MTDGSELRTLRTLTDANGTHFEAFLLDFTGTHDRNGDLSHVTIKPLGGGEVTVPFTCTEGDAGPTCAPDAWTHTLQVEPTNSWILVEATDETGLSSSLTVPLTHVWEFRFEPVVMAGMQDGPDATDCNRTTTEDHGFHRVDLSLQYAYYNPTQIDVWVEEGDASIAICQTSLYSHRTVLASSENGRASWNAQTGIEYHRLMGVSFSHQASLTSVHEDNPVRIRVEASFMETR